jgi:hypothetical protein
MSNRPSHAKRNARDDRQVAHDFDRYGNKRTQTAGLADWLVNPELLPRRPPPLPKVPQGPQR